MNIPESWLRSFCNPPLSGRELADKLTMAGVEVRPTSRSGRHSAVSWSPRCSAYEKHPNADKLTVCKVKTGKETLQVVCGAPNVRVGMKAPLAKIGTKEIRGVESQGMLCSARDLKLSRIIPGCSSCRRTRNPAAMRALRSVSTIMSSRSS